MMRSSDSIAALAAALSAAQAEIVNPAFDATNPHFGNGYASLAAVRNEVLPKLAKHGLSLLQPLVAGEGSAGCGTLLLHKSGEWLELDPILFPVAKPNAHGVAGAITYARRIGLQAVGACVGDDDDDGNAAAAMPAKPITARQTAQDEFDRMPAEAQAVVREWAMETIAHVEGGRADLAAAFVADKCETAEDKLALWSQLPPAVRAALKKEMGK